MWLYLATLRRSWKIFEFNKRHKQPWGKWGEFFGVNELMVGISVCCPNYKWQEKNKIWSKGTLLLIYLVKRPNYQVNILKKNSTLSYLYIYTYDNTHREKLKKIFTNVLVVITFRKVAWRCWMNSLIFSLQIIFTIHIFQCFQIKHIQGKDVKGEVLFNWRRERWQGEITEWESRRRQLLITNWEI